MIKRLSSHIVPKELQNKLDLFFNDLQEVGVAYIGHGIVSDEGNHSGYFSNRSWGESYVQNNYFFLEPILNSYEEKKSDLISWRRVEDSHSIVHKRTEYTKANSGLTICKKDKGYNTFFNVGFTQDIDLLDFTFFKRDLLIAYFKVFNNYHLMWREQKCF